MLALIALVGGVEASTSDPMPIVHGTPVSGADFPSVVSLARGTSSFCTGSLIHPDWVLTAAHCVDDVAGADVVFGNSVSGPADRIPIAEAIVHPDYDLDTFTADVALVRLAAPRTNGFLMALNPDEVEDSWVGLDVTFVGFGITAHEGSGAGVKRTADVPLIRFDDETLFTQDRELGRSTCQGDSGGPGLLQKGDAYVQVSITSFGQECGAGPSGSKRVDTFLPWIASIVGEVNTTPAAPPSFACSHELEAGEPNTIARGVLPLTLKCRSLDRDADAVDDIVWSWGDGEISNGFEVKHTYLEPGNYSMEVCFSGDSPAGEWAHCERRVGYVRACGVPDVAIEAERLEGTTWAFHNRTDLSTYGCIDDIAWDIFRGNAVGDPIATIAAWEPQFTFPDDGDYTVVLNVGGIAGTGAAETRISTSRGCQTVPLPASALLLLAVIASTRRRRL